MYIKQLTVKNYRNFGEPAFTIELKPFTLILGENNIGKTNLINALRLIFSQEITIFQKRFLEIDDINYCTVQNFKKNVCNLSIEAEEIEFPEVRIDVVLTDMNEDQDAVVGDWFTNPPELTEAKLTYLFSPRANFDKHDWIERQRARSDSEESLIEEQQERLIDFPIEEYRYTLFARDDPGNECNMYYLKMLKMECLDALRDAQKELIASGDYRLLYKILNQRDKTQYENIKQVLSELDAAVKQNPNLASIKEEVKELLDRVSLQTDDSDNRIDFNFSSPETSEMLKKISLIYGANPINVARNGLGRNNLLYISLVLSHLSAKDHSRDDETYFRLITVEEPEAHLHPHLQDHLAANIESIRKENHETMQLLLTSHSTHIAAKLNLENTVIVFYNQAQQTLNSHYILSGLDGKREKSTIHYLSKYLDTTKSRMFFARKIILVEGIAEQLLIPKFFEIYCANCVEKEGCNIINVNGVAFKHFLKIIRNGFFIKCLVLTDRDTGKTTQERAEDLKEEFDKGKIIRIEITEDTTFEKDIIATNRTGKGKSILLKALTATKPINGPKLSKELGESDIDVGTFFGEIEHYKAEFAFNLFAELETDPKGFNIPEYIKKGFKFMRG